MDVHVSNASSDDSSADSRRSSSSGERLDDFHSNMLQEGEILGYQFEPRRDGNSESDESAGNMSIDEDEANVRLGNLDW
jgi:hypothetical protein